MAPLSAVSDPARRAGGHRRCLGRRQRGRIGFAGLAQPGDPIDIDIWRQGARHTLHARLDALQPEENASRQQRMKGEENV